MSVGHLLASQASIAVMVIVLIRYTYHIDIGRYLILIMNNEMKKTIINDGRSDFTPT